MVVAIICVALFLVGVYYAVTDEWVGIGEKVFMSFLAGTISFIIFILLTLGVGWVFTDDDDFTVSEGSSTPLRALNTGGNETSGAFFLGFGTVEGNTVYTYITERGDGGFEMDTIPVDQVIVYENAGEQARIVRTKYIADNTFWTYYVPCGETIIYVPEGSVQEPSFNVTTEN